MILSIDWGLMIVIGAENKWPRAFSKWIKESWISKLGYIPVEARIENWIWVLPVVVWGLLEHQWPLWKVFDHPTCSGMICNSLPKSTCISSKWNFEFWVRDVTVGYQWSASSLWCMWMMFEWLDHKFLKPNHEFESYGSFASMMNMKCDMKWQFCKLMDMNCENCFLAFLVLILCFKHVIYWL